MARKTKVLTVVGGRDQGKVFLLTEMSAAGAEKWALKASSVIAKTGFDLPDGASWGALVALGFQAFLKGPWSEVEPLLDEMLLCVRIIPDPDKPEVTRYATAEGDIEDVTTYAKLRDEVFELHTGFSIAAVLSNLTAARETRTDASPDTPTSPPPSDG